MAWRLHIEFNNQGKFQDYTIDFEAMAYHIKELDLAAKKAGIGIWRIIFDPKLQPKLLQTQNGEYIAKFVRLSDKKSWVRHDEHYHVDFNIPCE